ncbi:transcriptional activator of glycolytic enzymes-domain-containing protein, partial [Rhypophila decipiens]
VSPEAEPPKHSMSRAVKTVSDLWREWTTGLQGGPSITALDNRWGSRWRAGRQAEVQWYSLRLEVIREIRRVAGMRRTSEETAVAFVAAEQRQSNCSLDLYCKRLRANRKIREADGTGGGASAGAEGRKGRRTAR